MNLHISFLHFFFAALDNNKVQVEIIVVHLRSFSNVKGLNPNS